MMWIQTLELFLKFLRFVNETFKENIEKNQVKNMLKLSREIWRHVCIKPSENSLKLLNETLVIC